VQPRACLGRLPQQHCQHGTVGRGTPGGTACVHELLYTVYDMVALALNVCLRYVYSTLQHSDPCRRGCRAEYGRYDDTSTRILDGLAVRLARLSATSRHDASLGLVSEVVASLWCCIRCRQSCCGCGVAVMRRVQCKTVAQINQQTNCQAGKVALCLPTRRDKRSCSVTADRDHLAYTGIYNCTGTSSRDRDRSIHLHTLTFDCVSDKRTQIQERQNKHSRTTE
jgi:hypothetical protein